MSVWIILLGLLLIVGIKIKLKEGFEDYISPQKSSAVKGVFTIIVVLSHVRQFVKVEPIFENSMYLDFMTYVGQLMVVMFLFYSGYGIAFGIKNKENYVQTIIKKRIPSVFIHFEIVVLIYYFLSLILGENYSLKHLLLSFAGILDVGNQVWFIVVIILLYLLAFISFSIFKKKIVLGTAIVTLLSLPLCIGIMMWQKENHWWYDTIFCYALGMWYAIAKPYIDKFMLNSFPKWLFGVGLTSICFLYFWHMVQKNGFDIKFFVPTALFFGLLLTFLSMRISVGNKILVWFGNRVFSVYMIHYIPMRVLTYFELNKYPVLFTAISIVATVALAEIFNRLTDKLDVALRLKKSSVANLKK